MRLIPSHGKVLIKTDKSREEVSKSGIIMPVTQAYPSTGIVVEVGEKLSNWKPNQRVVFDGGFPLTLNEEQHVLVDEKDIFGTFE